MTFKTETLAPIVVETGANPSASIIWLHGLGADGHDFEPIVPHLALPPQTAVRFIFPHAPIRPVTINNGFEMRAWYDIRSADIADPERADSDAIAESVQFVRDLIAEQIAAGIASENIILAGFSQGGVIALQTALQYEQPLGGLMVLSSYIALPEIIAEQRLAANENIPLFLAHGLYDGVLPFALAEQAQQHLRSWGYTFTFKQYAMEHSVGPEEIHDIDQWLTSLEALQCAR